MTDATIGIVVDPRGAVTGARTVRRSLDEMIDGARGATQGANRLNSSLQQLKRIAGSLGLGVSIAALRSFTQGLINSADALNMTAARVGVTSNALQRMSFAAAQTGVASNTLEMALQRLTRRFGEAAQGKGELVGILEQYNIAIKDAEGRTRDTEEVFADLADRIANAGSSAEQLRIAFKAFDSEGAALVNTLRNGSQGLREYYAEADRLGLVLSADLLPVASEFTSQIDMLNRAVRTQVTEGLLRTMAKDAMDLRNVIADPAFQQGLQIVGASITFIGREALASATSIGALVMALRDLDPSKLLDVGVAGLLQRILRDFGLLKGEIEDTADAAFGAGGPLGDLGDTFDDLGGAAGGAADELGNVMTALTRQNERLGLMVQATEQGEDAVEKLNIAFQVHDELLAAGVVPATMSLHEAMALTAEGADENARAIGVLVRENARYERQLEDTRSAQEKAKRAQQDAAREAKRLAEEQGRNFNRIVDDTVRYGSDLFADLFRDTSSGWRGMWDNMLETMKAALVRMAAEAALRPIVVSVLGAMGVAGAGAAAGAAGMAPGGGGILGSLFGMGQQAASLGGGGLFSSGIFGAEGALSGVGSFMSKPLFMVPTGAIEAGTGAMAMAPGISLGGVLGAAGLGYMGGGLIAQLTGGNQMGGSLGGAGGAALGAAIGSAVPGIGTVLGGIAGGLLGGGIGSLFGGGGNTDQQIRPYSHALGTGKGVETPFREFRNSAHRFDGGPLQNAIVEADKAIAAALSDRAIEQVRDYFDLAGTIKGSKRDNKELGPKHFARFIRDSFTDMMEALGGTAAREGFGRMASGLGNDPDAVLALAQQAAVFLGNLADNRLFKPQEVSQLEAAWDALNEQGEEFKRLATELGQPVEEVMRQLREAQQAFHDEIQQGYQDQIDGMLRPTELAWRQLREAQAKEIEELEKVEASTAKARQWHQLQIRALFEQNYELQRMYLEGLIDLGDDLNAQIGALWGIVSTGIGGLIADSNAAYQEAVRLGRQYAQINRNLQQTIAGLRTGPQSPLSLEQQLMEALDRFRQTLGEALGGDSEAAQQLQQLVNPVLDLASQFFGRTEGYAQIFDEVLRGLEMAGVAMETQAGGFAALASALEAQIDILNDINDVLNRRDELGEDFESRYNKLTSELEDVGYTIGGINAFLQDAADAIPTTIVTAFASGLDSAQLAKRMGELFQATVTATEQAMRDGVEDIGAAIDGAQQALLRGWIPDFIELAEQFNGAIPEIRFDRVTARAVAHYEASADQLGSGLRSAVAQVQFDGLQQAIYTAQELVGTRFDAAVGGISFEGIDGEYLSAVLYDGITGIAQAAQVSLNGQAQRIEGVIDRTLEAFTLDATRATILDSVDIINNGATSVQLAFGRVEGALLRLSNNADGHITALIGEVDAAIARFTNWGTGSLRVGVESLRTGLLDVRNAGEGALELWADTVEARETRISNLGPGALAARINSLRGQLVNVRNSGAGLLEFWADTVESRATVIENIDRGNIRAVINDLRAGILTIRNRAAGHLQFWASRVEAGETRIENIDRGDLSATIGTLRSALVTIRNLGTGRLEFWAETLKAQETRIENLNAGTLVARINNLRSALLTIRNAGEGALLLFADAVEAREATIENLDAGNLVARIQDLRADLLSIRNAGQGRLNFWANRVEARRATIENLDEGLLVTRIGNLRSALLTIRNTGQGRLAFWADEVNAQRVRIEDLGAHPILVQINQLRAGLVEIRTLGADRIASWRDVVEGHRAEINGIGIGDINANGNQLRARLTNVRNVSQHKLAGWRNVVQARLDQIRDIDAGNIPTNANQLRGALASTRNTAQNKLANWMKQVQNGLNAITNISNDLGGGAIAAELKKIVENRLPKRFGEAIDRAFENVFGTDSPTSFLQNMSSLVGANSALVTSLRSLAQTIQMSAENAEQIRRGRVDTYAQGVKGSVQDALGAGVAAGSRTVTDYISNPVYRDGNLAGYDMIKTEKQVRDDSNRKTPLEAALAEIAAHFQQMLGLGNLPKRTLKVDDGKPYFEQLAIAGYGSVATKKLNDMRTMASFMLESYADWAMKGDRVSAEARKLLDGRNWGPGNVQNALANLAKSLGYAGLLPSFATGGYHTGGLALVGEQGPELVDFASPSRIYSAPDTSRIMAGFANDNGSFRELIAEVRALRAENAELRRTVSEGFGDTVQAEGVSGTAIRAEIRGLREDVEELQTATRQQQRRASA